MEKPTRGRKARNDLGVEMTDLRDAISSRSRIRAGLAVVALMLCGRVIPTAAQEYRLGPGDKVRVVVLTDTEASGEYEVDATGMINAKYVGRIKAAGLTTAELEAELSQRYRSVGVLRSPRLSVELMTARPFYILGEVSKPGSYPYVAGLTIAQAVAIAGGYTRRASTSRIRIKRYGDGAQGEQTVTEDTAVQPGDVIRVPERFF